jgi:hypothetical protein
MTEHSKLMSPSASGLWLKCTGQPQAKLDLGLVQSSSPAADLGTLKHHYAEQIKLGKWDVNTPAPDMPADEWKDVPKALNMLDRTMPTLSPNTKHWYEMKVGFKEEWRKDCFGTVDVVTLDVTSKTLYISDYKFGRGRVSATLNTQLMIYALCVIDELRSSGVDVDKCIGIVRLQIIQPKTSSVAGVFEIWKAGLEKWDVDTLQPAQRLITEGNGTFETGPWCGEKYCELQKQNKCPLITQETIDIMDSFIDMDGAISTAVDESGLMTEGELRLLRMSKTFKKVLDAVAEKAEGLAKAGEDVPGFKLVKNDGFRKWQDEAAADTFLTGQKIKLDERWPKKFVTAPQAETILKKSGALEKPRTKSRFEELIVWTEGKIALVPDEDPREEYVAVNTDDLIDNLFDLTTTPAKIEEAKLDTAELDDMFDLL